MKDLSAFHITHFPSGKQNITIIDSVSALAIIPGGSVYAQNTMKSQSTTDTPNQIPWWGGVLRVTIELSDAKSVTMEYSVYFPADFDWVKGEKLPGLYGGYTWSAIKRIDIFYREVPRQKKKKKTTSKSSTSPTPQQTQGGLLATLAVTALAQEAVASQSSAIHTAQEAPTILVADRICLEYYYSNEPAVDFVGLFFSTFLSTETAGPLPNNTQPAGTAGNATTTNDEPIRSGNPAHTSLQIHYTVTEHGVTDRRITLVRQKRESY
ncbi:hypothetical protein BDR07DRAFT_1377137 [Suillus spraguei]|nr:hypothetical protein BDR07DRAFT_1377137 [Suillus spraguei]